MSGVYSEKIVLVPAITPNSSLLGAFAGLDPATLQTFLTNAQTALAALLSGQKASIVSYGEGSGQKSVTYSRTNEPALRRHISELQILLGQRPPRRAIRFR